MADMPNATVHNISIINIAVANPITVIINSLSFMRRIPFEIYRRWIHTKYRLTYRAGCKPGRLYNILVATAERSARSRDLVILHIVTM